MSIYELLAHVYDAFNDEIDYQTWAEKIDTWIREYGTPGDKVVLDLGCGTGSMTIPLSRLGYEMIGLDLSLEMLTYAREREELEGQTGILWTQQDMTEFALYSPVDVVVSALDSMNHLWRRGDLQKCFTNVSEFLTPGGLFIFDVNSQQKFETIYGDQTYVYETENAFCVWQNDYNPKSKLCDFYITLFEVTEEGTYCREDAVQTERFYSIRQLKKALDEAGLDLIATFGGLDGQDITSEDQRWYLIARKREV